MIAHPMRCARSAGVALLATALLGGCTSFSSDGGMDAVSGMTSQALKADVVALRGDDDIAAAEAKVAALLRRPLTADAAVQIALLNNRDLQAAYDELGIAEAARLRASLPAAPRFSLSRLAGGGGFEIEAQVVGNILSLATLPARANIASDRFRQAQLRAAEATLRTGFEARRAFADAVASRQ
ncbi:MAG: TolC family protein, partial [Hyphomicrobiales bacterium]